MKHAPPPRSSSWSRRLRAVPSLLAGALAIALAAQVSVSIPGSPVPQSLQTLAVVVVGGLLGARGGGAAALVYLAVGAAGLPVFAEGAAGVSRLWGPTSGYLAGFVAGAVLTGWWVARGPGRGFGRLVAATMVGHAVILALGWVRLAWLLDPGDAVAQGVTPFLWGGVVKALAAAGILVAWGRWGRSRRQVRPEPPGGGGPVEPGTPPV